MASGMRAVFSTTRVFVAQWQARRKALVSDMPDRINKMREDGVRAGSNIEVKDWSSMPSDKVCR